MQLLLISCALVFGHVSGVALSPQAALMRMEFRNEGEHPIAKVISMLEDLKVKAREQGEEEAVNYQKFEYWCKNTIKELTTAIANDKDTIETLERKPTSR
jgi:hypothetical protein